MKNLLIFVLGAVLLCACTQSNKSADKLPTVPKMQKYENEYFSIRYPSNWECQEDVNNMCDTLPAFSKGLLATFWNPDPSLPYLVVSVQKSAMFHVFKTPEEWRDLSVQLKQFSKEYIATIDAYMLDSLDFEPYPAAMAGFIVKPEDGDTLVHVQIVVMVDSDVYYLNNTFDYHSDGKLEEFGDVILSSIEFKKKPRH